MSVDVDAGLAVGAGKDKLYGVIEVYGSPYADRINGASGNGAVLEFLAGVGGDDVIDGRGGRDWVKGGPGDDTITGGEGADDLDGDEGAEPCSRARARPTGASTAARTPILRRSSTRPTRWPAARRPAETRRPRARRPDRSRPGPGDPVHPGPGDLIDPGSWSGNPGEGPGDPGVGPDPSAPFSCNASAPRQTLVSARRRGVAITVACAHVTRLTARLTVSASTARALKLTRSRSARRVTVGQATLSTAEASFAIRLSTKARRALTRAPRVTLTLEVSARVDDLTVTRRLAVPLSIG